MKTDHETKVRERAYALWVESGRPTGTSNKDWLRAEQELGAAGGPPSAAPSQRPRSATTAKPVTPKPVTSRPVTAKPASAKRVAASAPRVSGEGSPPIRRA